MEVLSWGGCRDNRGSATRPKKLTAPSDRGSVWAMSSCFEDLEFRGLVHQVSDAGLAKRLDSEQLTAYSGFDPSADSLHVGHLLGILCLRRLQEGGHRPIALAGGGTGMIGDPGGKSEERALLGREELRGNLQRIRAQLERLLDFGGGAGALLLDNGSWLWDVGLLEFLRETGKSFTVNQMLAKESVRSRLESRDQGISFTEFSYMLLQAYDFLHLFETEGCRLQLGGSDQWGNITMGIDLIRRRKGAEAWGLTWPLIVRPDGGKLGKSESGTVWLDPARTSPYDFYQYFVRTDDRIVGRYLRLFTWLEHDRIIDLDRSVAEQPERREAQRILAREVTALVHGDVESRRAERTSEALFSGDLSGLDEDALLDAFKQAPSTSLPMSSLEAGGLELVDVLASTGLSSSKSSARQTIRQGGAYVNYSRETEPGRRLGAGDLLLGHYLLLSRGRKEHHLLRFS